MTNETKSNNEIQTLKCANNDAGRKKLFELYGNNYEILERRHYLDSHFFGLFNKEGVELTYRVIKANDFQKQSAPQVKVQSSVSKKEINDFEKNKSDILFKNAVQNKISDQDEKLENILTKLDELKISTGEKHQTILKIEELLRNNDFSFSYINEITNRIEKEFSVSQLNDFDRVQRAVVDWIGQSIKCEKPTFHPKPEVTVLVGPTGVGKTTTLVKLAALTFTRLKSEEYRPKVCFITVDTMRVAAYEQLKAWGKWFDTEVLVAQNVKDVTKHYLDVKDSVDSIFIDTSGYSPNDSSHIGMLKEMLDVPNLDPEIYLTISATTKARDIANIIRNYEPFGYKSVIITKCDESDQYGNIISVLHEKRKSVAYVTNGQNIARTIQKASVVDFLIRLEGFKIDRVHIEDIFGEN